MHRPGKHEWKDRGKGPLPEYLRRLERRGNIALYDQMIYITKFKPQYLDRTNINMFEYLW